MPNSRIPYKEIIAVVGFAITVTIFVVSMKSQAKDHAAEMVLLKDQVARNTKELDENDLSLLVYKIDDLDKKVDRAIELLLESQ